MNIKTSDDIIRDLQQEKLEYKEVIIDLYRLLKSIEEIDIKIKKLLKKEL